MMISVKLNNHALFRYAVLILLLLDATCMRTLVSSLQSSSTSSRQQQQTSHLQYTTQRDEQQEQQQFPPDSNDANRKTDVFIKTFEPSSKNDNNDLLSLQEQAIQLRQEAESLRIALEERKNNKIERERMKVDQWIEVLLIESKIDNNTDLLKNVDQVYQTMMRKRFSSEQVFKIFNRLSQIRIEQGREKESRSNCSPEMSLLIDAANKLDSTERDNNPNKRWNYKVERILQKKLFARDWNIEYVSDEEPDQQ